MRSHTRHLIIAAATALLPTLTLAQNPPPPTPAPPAPEVTTPLAPTTAPLVPNFMQGVERIDLQLDGSVTLRDYVDHLHEVSKANFILLNDPLIEPTEIRLPPLNLKRIPLNTAVHLLTQLPGVRIEVEKIPDDEMQTWSVLVRTPEPMQPLVGQDGKMGIARPDLAAGRPVTKLYPLERMLLGEDGAAKLDRNDEAQVKALNDRIEQTLQLIDVTLLTQATGQNGVGDRAQINLHNSTRTLIVKGTKEQIASVEEAINAMKLPQPTIESKRDVIDQQRAVMAAEVEALRAQVARMRQSSAPTTQP